MTAPMSALSGGIELPGTGGPSDPAETEPGAVARSEWANLSEEPDAWAGSLDYAGLPLVDRQLPRRRPGVFGVQATLR
jgi:hypothetical protein